MGNIKLYAPLDGLIFPPEFKAPREKANGNINEAMTPMATWS